MGLPSCLIVWFLNICVCRSLISTCLRSTQITNVQNVFDPQFIGGKHEMFHFPLDEIMNYFCHFCHQCSI